MASLHHVYVLVQSVLSFKEIWSGFQASKNYEHLNIDDFGDKTAVISECSLTEKYMVSWEEFLIYIWVSSCQEIALIEEQF